MTLTEKKADKAEKKSEKVETNRADLAGLTHQQLVERAEGFQLKGISHGNTDQEIIDALVEYQNGLADVGTKDAEVSDKPLEKDDKDLDKLLKKHKENGLEVFYGEGFITLRKGGLEESINSSANENDILAVANRIAK